SRRRPPTVRRRGDRRARADADRLELRLRRPARAAGAREPVPFQALADPGRLLAAGCTGRGLAGAGALLPAVGPRGARLAHPHDRVGATLARLLRGPARTHGSGRRRERRRPLRTVPLGGPQLLAPARIERAEAHDAGGDRWVG